MSGSFPSLNMYSSDRNSSFVIQGTHHVEFLCFSKDKSLELQCHQEQDKQQLRPSHIIFVNYLNLDRAYVSHEFQVQSKSLYQNNFIQNLGEFKAENQILERICNRATIHHFHFKRLSSESFLFYSALKNKLKQTRHTLFILFLFFRSHIITILLDMHVQHKCLVGFQ